MAWGKQIIPNISNAFMVYKACNKDNMQHRQVYFAIYTNILFNLCGLKGQSSISYLRRELKEVTREGWDKKMEPSASLQRWSWSGSLKKGPRMPLSKSANKKCSKSSISLWCDQRSCCWNNNKLNDFIIFRLSSILTKASSIVSSPNLLVAMAEVNRVLIGSNNNNNHHFSGGTSQHPVENPWMRFLLVVAFAVFSSLKPHFLLF